MPDGIHDRLHLNDLVDALSLFKNGRYHTIAVFADDVASLALLQQRQSPESTASDVHRLSVMVNEKNFLLSVSAEGVVRLSRSTLPKPAGQGVFISGFLEHAIRRARAKKGASGVPGIFGVLIGPSINGTPSSDTEPGEPRFVFVVQFDSTRQWIAYDGGLVRWLKEELCGSNQVDRLAKPAQ